MPEGQTVNPQAEQQNIRQILETISDAFYAVDRDWRLTYVNRRAADLWGKQPEEVLGRKLWDVFPQAVGSVPYHQFMRAIQEQRNIEFETISPVNHRWITCVACPSDMGLTVYFRDISERKHAEEEVARLLAAEQAARQTAEQAASRLGRLQAVTAALAYAITPTQVCEVIIEQALAAFGACAGSVVLITAEGEALEVVKAIGYAEGLIQSYQRFPLTASIPLADAARTGAPIWIPSRDAWHTRYPHLTETVEATKHQAWAALPLAVSDRVLGGIGLSFEEPRLFTAEDQAFFLALAQQCAQALDRARLYDEAQQAIALRDDFLSIASHELRTPLTALHAQAQLLLRYVGQGKLNQLSPERLTRMFEIIEGQVKRLTTLVHGLLDVSRITAGRLELERTEVDLVAITREVVERCAVQARATGSQIVLHTLTPVVGIWDPSRLDQVVTNLLSNAIKYGRGQPIHVRVEAEGATARLVVQDQGIGIAASDLHRIFERFERVIADGHYEGIGLGLYITRQIVEAHGGMIEVTSEAGVGSTFTVILPKHYE